MTLTEVDGSSLTVSMSKGYIARRKKLVSLQSFHALTAVAWTETSHPVQTPWDRVVLDVGVGADGVAAPCVSGSGNGQEWPSQKPAFHRRDQQKEHSRLSW